MIPSIGAAQGLVFVLILAVYAMIALSAIVGLIATWRIISKTGNAGALALLMLVPLGNLFLILWLALSQWPVEKELEQLRARHQGQANDSW